MDGTISRLSKTLLRSLIVLSVGCLHAQVDRHSLPPSQSGTANYYFAKPNDLTIVVDVLGAVQRPGRYEVAKEINLINLLALAGGAASDGALDDVKITRILDTPGKVTKIELRVDLENIVRVHTGSLVLQPDDVIQVGRSGWSAFREGFGIVVGAAIITGAVAQIIYATKR
jgi:hypothetical protein